MMKTLSYLAIIAFTWFLNFIVQRDVSKVQISGVNRDD